MTGTCLHRSRVVCLVASFSVSLFMSGVVLTGPAAAQSGDGYVGDAMCNTCHGDSLGNYQHTIHAKVLNETNGRTALERRSCEACHGPGQAHVEAGGGKGTGGPDWVSFEGTDKESVDAANGRCLQCHDSGAQRYWTGSPHQSRGRACADCHNVMNPESDKALLAKPSQMALCSQCHPMPRSQMMRRSHMPQRPGTPGGGGEDYMNCGSCHNPHGTVTAKLVKAASVNELCYECHAEKRGPFLWEHAPVNENCLNCHVPHGSTNANLQKQAPPRGCQQCHIQTLHPSNTYDRENRFAVGKQCLHCHQHIHGSNHPSGAFFTR